MSGNEFVTTKVVEVKEINTEKVTAYVKTYLENNDIAGHKYSLDHVSTMEDDCLIIYLNRNSANPIDEDFSDDKPWDRFCSGLANKVGRHYCGVPFWYYSK